MALISSIIFAYSMNNIGEILKDLGVRSAFFRTKMVYLNQYMEKRNLNKELKMKVRKYFEYLHIENNDDDEQGGEIINKMALSLKNEVLKDIYGRIIRSKRFFKLVFS